MYLIECRQWSHAIDWLQNELEHRYPANSQYSYNTWSPPAQSNESSNGYFLERSNSARNTLALAIELMPEPEREEEEGGGGGGGGGSEEQESQEETADAASQGEENGATRSDLPDVTQSCENTSNT